MNAPQKPWETDLSNRANNTLIRQLPERPRNAPTPTTHSLLWPSGSSESPRPVPPIPPRTMTGIRFNMVPTTPNMYGGYNGYTGYGGYSTYGNQFGGMYMPGGSYGNLNNSFENRFLQAAEEGSRNAFQSVASLVQAFSSVSMMLESTYHAMYSSFRAVLGVIDNFSRLRLVFTQFLSAITILRTIKSFYRRLLYWLGILKSNPQVDDVWSSAAHTSVQQSNQSDKFSSWPLIAFFGVLFGGPYLITKYFSTKLQNWDPREGIMVTTLYPLKTRLETDLCFDANEVLELAPQKLQMNRSWLLARNLHGKVGYVPSNFICIKDNQTDIFKLQNWDPKEGVMVTALFPLKTGSETDLCFDANEVLEIAPQKLQIDKNWLLAKNRQGKVGYVPKDFIILNKKATSVSNDKDPRIST